MNTLNEYRNWSLFPHISTVFGFSYIYVGGEYSDFDFDFFLLLSFGKRCRWDEMRWDGYYIIYTYMHTLHETRKGIRKVGKVIKFLVYTNLLLRDW